MAAALRLARKALQNVGRANQVLQNAVEDAKVALRNAGNLGANVARNIGDVGEQAVKNVRQVLRNTVADVQLRLRPAEVQREYARNVNPAEVMRAGLPPMFLFRNFNERQRDIMNAQVGKDVRETRRLGEEVDKFLNKGYTFYFNTITSFDDIHAKLERVFQKLSTKNRSFKIRVEFGEILMHTVRNEEGERQVFHVFLPGQNTSLERDLALVSNRMDMNRFYETLALGNMERFIDKFNRPNTRTQVVAVFSMIVKVFRLDQRMGAIAEVPEVMKTNKSIICFAGYDDQLCFWRCLHKGMNPGARPDRCSEGARQLYKQFYNADYTNAYGGLNVAEVIEVEKKFNVRINVFACGVDAENKIELTVVQWFSNVGERHHNMRADVPTINLAVYLNHFMFVKKIESFSSWTCPECGYKTDRHLHLLRHLKSDCEHRFQEVFEKESKVFMPKGNLKTELYTRYFNRAPECPLNPYLIVWDFEALQRGIPVENNDNNLTYTFEQVPVSYSVASNVPGFQQVKFECSNDPHALVANFVAYVMEVSKKAYELAAAPFDVKAVECDRNLQKWLRCPVLGFNSGFYDINLIKSYDAFQKIIAHDDQTPNIIIKGPKYFFVSTKYAEFLDVMNYLAPGFNLRKFIGAYKTSADVSGKGHFPYRWLTSYDKLNETQLPSEEMWESPEAYIEMQKVWEEKKFANMMEFLRWYNDLDVLPFLDACNGFRNKFVKYGFDVFKDAMSIPGIAEKIMFKSVMSSRDEFERRFNAIRHDDSTSITTLLNPRLMQAKVDGYRSQDSFRGQETTLTAQDLMNAIRKYGRTCFYCKSYIEFFANFTWDRIDNTKGHSSEGVICCRKCNSERADHYSHEEFRLRKLQEAYYAEFGAPMLIDEENKEVFFKLKAAITGGPSIVFHRSAKAGVSRINKAVWRDNKWGLPEEPGKVIGKILGFDANALYLWCLGQDMPCGKLTYESFDQGHDSKYIQAFINSHFGFIECDIETPERLYQQMADFPPVFINRVVPETPEVIGQFMSDLIKDKLNDGKINTNPCKKLISVFSAKKILLYKPLYEWYIAHGLQITKVYGMVVCGAPPRKCFADFVKNVSEDRLRGDREKAFEVEAETAKLIGNSGYGRCGMNKNKHTKSDLMTDEAKVDRAIAHFTFRDCDELGGVVGGGATFQTLYQIKKAKQKTKQNMPVQVSVAVYQLAKLRMLQFYYDFLARFIAPEDFQMMYMDTDSCYFAMTALDMKEIVKPELKEVFERESPQWLVLNKNITEYAPFAHRTPGLFKVEYEARSMEALASKLYICKPWGDGKSKFSCKGTQKERNKALITEENFQSVRENSVPVLVMNEGMRAVNGTVAWYKQSKRGLNFAYTKRQVLPDGITTAPLMF